MKAAILYGKEDIRMVDVPEPKITGVRDVIVKPKMIGICGTDIHNFHLKNPFLTLPRILGHEIAGEVVEVGKEVTTVAPGDHVVIDPVISCGTCYACQNNMANCCDNVRCFGVAMDGGLQEKFVIDALNLVKMDKSLAWEEAVLAEPFTIGANSAMRGDIRPGDRVLIQGAGPIGLCCLKMAKIRGAQVMISDIFDDKLEYAQKQGADFIVNAKTQNLADAVKEWTKGEMANVVIDAANTFPTNEACFNLVSAAGRIVLLILEVGDIKIQPYLITKKQLTVVGSRMNSHQVAPVVRLMESGMLKGDGMVTQKFPFAKTPEAFKWTAEHNAEVRKAVIEF
jgi:L-gulonate 5-dehydrogenase